MGKKVFGEDVAAGLEVRYDVYIKNSRKDKPSFFGKWENELSTNVLEKVKEYLSKSFKGWPFVSQIQKNGELILIFWDNPRPGTPAARNLDVYSVRYVHVRIVPILYYA